MATLQNNIPALIRRMRRGAARVATQTAHAIEADIKQGMAGPKSGRTYQGKGGTHQASAPGESPAIEHGSYANSFQVADVGETTKAVGTTDERGPTLELGGAHTEPRPHVGPAFERAAGQFEADLKTIFEG